MNGMAKSGIILVLTGFGLYGLARAMPRNPAPTTKLTSETPRPQPPVRQVPVTDAELTGTYYFGDGLGVNCHLDLKADHTFMFRWTGCMGEYDRNEGKWEVKGDMVVLDPKDENKHEGFEGVNVRFLPTIWNHKLFLVDEYEAPGFCSSLRKNVEKGLINNIHGDSFVRVNDKTFVQTTVKHDNFVSPRFAAFIGKKPVACQVMEVLPNGHVVLDEGSDEGLRAGLMLQADEWNTGDLEIVSVSSTTAEAVPGYFFNSTTKVKVGDKFDTGGDYSQPHGTGWDRLPEPPDKK
jgi:hypothetical protein